MFGRQQKKILEELLADDNNVLWSAVLYGFASPDGQIVAVALSQVGNVGGQPYWSWYGVSYHVEWCACFVSWCANECGYIENGVIPKFAGFATGVRWDGGIPLRETPGMPADSGAILLGIMKLWGMDSRRTETRPAALL